VKHPPPMVRQPPSAGVFGSPIRPRGVQATLCIEGVISVLQDGALAPQAAGLLSYFEEHCRGPRRLGKPNERCFGRGPG